MLHPKERYEHPTDERVTLMMNSIIAYAVHTVGVPENAMLSLNSDNEMFDWCKRKYKLLSRQNNNQRFRSLLVHTKSMKNINLLSLIPQNWVQPKKLRARKEPIDYTKPIDSEGGDRAPGDSGDSGDTDTTGTNTDNAAVTETPDTTADSETTGGEQGD